MTASEPSTSEILRIDRRAPVNGYILGFKQPILLVELTRLDTTEFESHLRYFEQLIQQITGSNQESYLSSPPRDPVVDTMIQATLRILAFAGIPLLTKAYLKKAPGGERTFRVSLPAIHGGFVAISQLLEGLVDILNNPKPDTDEHLQEVKLKLAIQRVTRAAPSGMNTLRFLEAAHDIGIPWRRVSGNVFQFGWGKLSRWLDSSFTDATPNISAKLARDKVSAAKVMRDAAIPVPQHMLVRSEDDAIAAAGRLGFPVVVKAGDLDGGKGVFTHLKTKEAVLEAYRAVVKLTTEVLVEKHFEGNDYRLQVFHNEVYWAVHRRPASVTGDGVQTIESLIHEVNSAPERGPADSPLLKEIIIDDEVHEWLNDQGYTLSAIPEKGCLVRLKGAANIASGGTLEPVLESAHPDNLDLAIRAARILKLDLAGVDLLIPDIGKSWLESGAAICEINGQPQLSPHLPRYLMERLVKRRGRIPVVLVIGNPEQEPWLAQISSGLENRNLTFGQLLPDRLQMGSSCVKRGATNCLHDGIALLGDPLLDCALLAVWNSDVLSTGLPVDTFDALILSGPIVDRQGQVDWPASVNLARSLSKLGERLYACAGHSEWDNFKTPSATAQTMTDDNLARALVPLLGNQAYEKDAIKSE